MRENKQENQLITVEEFLNFKPKRCSFDWYKNEDGIITIVVPKFQRNLGRSFCKLIKRKETFSARLDYIGSLVWEHCDGMYTVRDILTMLKERFPEEKNLDQRLFYFLEQMRQLKYLVYE